MRSSGEQPWNEVEVDRVLAAALAEDVGRGDVTSRAVLPAGCEAVAHIRAKEDLVVAGLELVPRLYGRLGAVTVETMVADGAAVVRGTVVQRICGDARTVLTGERTVLNLVQHLCGIATLTRRCVEKLNGSGCVLRDTRKTLPGLRTLEKYAVRMGGGTNHRLRLDDGVLIKDNHVDLAGGICAAVRAARKADTGLSIEVECRTIADVREALDAGADMILLDNMTLRETRQAVEAVAGRISVEASGGITPERVRGIADCGVDFVALGCVTHSAPAADLSMVMDKGGSRTATSLRAGAEG